MVFLAVCCLEQGLTDYSECTFIDFFSTKHVFNIDNIATNDRNCKDVDAVISIDIVNKMVTILDLIGNVPYLETTMFKVKFADTSKHLAQDFPSHG